MINNEIDDDEDEDDDNRGNEMMEALTKETRT